MGIDQAQTGAPGGPPLGELLVGRGLITGEQLEQALAEQREDGRPLGEIIVGLGFAAGPTIAQALATQHGRMFKSEYGWATGFDTTLPEAEEGVADPPPVTTGSSRPPVQSDSSGDVYTAGPLTGLELRRASTSESASAADISPDSPWNLQRHQSAPEPALDKDEAAADAHLNRPAEQPLDATAEDSATAESESAATHAPRLEAETAPESDLIETLQNQLVHEHHAPSDRDMHESLATDFGSPAPKERVEPVTPSSDATDAAQTASQLFDLRLHIATLESELKLARTQRDQATADLQAAQAAYEALQTRLDEVTAMHPPADEWTQRIAELQAQLDQAYAQLHEADAKLQNALSEKAAAADVSACSTQAETEILALRLRIAELEDALALERKERDEVAADLLAAHAAREALQMRFEELLGTRGNSERFAQRSEEHAGLDETPTEDEVTEGKPYSTDLLEHRTGITDEVEEARRDAHAFEPEDVIEPSGSLPSEHEQGDDAAAAPGTEQTAQDGLDSYFTTEPLPEPDLQVPEPDLQMQAENSAAAKQHHHYPEGAYAESWSLGVWPPTAASNLSHQRANLELEAAESIEPLPRADGDTQPASATPDTRETTLEPLPQADHDTQPASVTDNTGEATLEPLSQADRDTQPASATPDTGKSTQHLVFFLAAGRGYALIEQTGHPPAVGDLIDVSAYGGPAIASVVQVAAAPLPRSPLRCAYLI